MCAGLRSHYAHERPTQSTSFMKDMAAWPARRTLVHIAPRMANYIRPAAFGFRDTQFGARQTNVFACLTAFSSATIGVETNACFEVPLVLGKAIIVILIIICGSSD